MKIRVTIEQNETLKFHNSAIKYDNKTFFKSVGLFLFLLHFHVDTFDSCYINHNIDKDRELKIKYLDYDHSNKNWEKEWKKNFLVRGE